MKKNHLQKGPFRRYLEHLLLITKLTVFLLFSGLMTVSASIYSNQTKLTFDLKEASYLDVFHQIEENSEFVFIYKNEVVDLKKRVDLKIEDSSIEVILDELFKDSGIHYEILKKQIILTPDRTIPARVQERINENSEQPKSVKRTLSGKVTDITGEPIPGTSVIVKGTTTGTITDFDGNFTLEIPDSATTIVFSFVGFEKQEVLIGTSMFFNIVLKETTVGVEEVVVVGYGEQKKESVVGAISQATGDQLQKMNVPEVANSLTGLIPGMVTIKTSGLPGGFSPKGGGQNYDASTQIFLRGQSTWNGGSPLVLVDGVERSIDDVDPNEVESISVLKDASATSVFGVKGANGVILVTTKRGDESKAQINFDAQYTMSFISKIASPMNSYDVNELKNRAIQNELAVNPPSWDFYTPYRYLQYYKTQEYPELFPDVKWRDYMVKDIASSYKMSVNVAGGTKFVKYFGALSYTHEGSIIDGKDLGTGYKPSMNFDRLNIRSNLDFQFTPTTRVALNLAGSYGRQSDVAAYSNNWRIWSGVYLRPPDSFPVQYSDGTYADDNSDFPNPYVLLNFGGIDYFSRVQFSTDIKLTQKLDMITKGLSAGASVSYDNRYSSQGPRVGSSNIQTKWIDKEAVDDLENIELYTHWNTIIPKTGYRWVLNPTTWSGEEFNSNSRRLFYEFRLEYARDFGKHAISALALMNRNEGASGSGFPNKREDWVGRVTYNFGTRYFFEANGGYNGSEKFDRKYRFGFFPSLAAGWMVSNEKFFQDALPWWNRLKARYSLGWVGSDDGIDRWLYVNSWNVYDKSWIFGIPTGQPSGYFLSEEGDIANPDIRWETARKQNLGFDMGFFNDKIKASIELFKENRDGMLIKSADRANYDLFGANLPPGNLGKTETKGYEAELKYDTRFRNGISFSLQASHGYAKDRIIFKDDPQLRPDYQKAAGFAIGQTREYLSAGVIQSWDELYTTVLDASNANRLPGDFKSVDFNADGVIDAKDRVPYGYPSRPEHNYTFTIGAGYKGFSISAMFYGVYNVTIDEGYYTIWPYNVYSVAFPWHRDDSWSPERGQTTSASLNAIRYKSTKQTSGFAQYNLIDGSYLKLQNVQLAYKLNKAQLKKVGVGSLSLYVTGYDLLFFSKLRENREGPSNPGGGGVYTSYPLMKRITFGLKVGL